MAPPLLRASRGFREETESGLPRTQLPPKLCCFLGLLFTPGPVDRIHHTHTQRIGVVVISKKLSAARGESGGNGANQYPSLGSLGNGGWDEVGGLLPHLRGAVFKIEPFDWVSCIC